MALDSSTDVIITPEEQARRAMMMGLRPPNLDPNRVQPIPVSAPNIQPTQGLNTSTLPDLGPSPTLPTDVRMGPVKPSGLPDPSGIMSIPPRSGAKARLAEVGMFALGTLGGGGLRGGLTQAEDYANAPRIKAMQQYTLDRQHALDQAGIDNKEATDETKRDIAELAAQSRQGVAQTGADSREKVADIGATSREDVATTQQGGATTREGMKETSAEGIAGSKLDAQQSNFRDTLEFKKWKENQDNMTKQGIAKMRTSASENKAPAAMMQTAEFAQGGLEQLGAAQDALKKLRAHGVINNWATNKIEDQVFGAGAVDPSLSDEDKKLMGQVRAALTYTSSAAMRAHTGRTSREIYDDFKSTTKLGQGLDALDGALGQTSDMLNHYSIAASDEAIRRLRAGEPPIKVGAPAAAPSGAIGLERGPDGKLRVKGK